MRLTKEAKITWGLTALSIAGVVLNVMKMRAGFGVWMFTNICWCVIDWRKGIPAQSFLFFVYFVLSVWGWVAWS